METKFYKYKIKLFDSEDNDFNFYAFVKSIDSYKNETLDKMDTKLFVYKIKLFEHEDSGFSFFALAENEEEAKRLILHKIKNELYKSLVENKFNDPEFKPTVLQKKEVFITHTGSIKLFSQ